MPKANPLRDAAYTVVPGITREKAEEKGYVVVEHAISGNDQIPIYGYYNNTQSGGALDVTMPKPADTQVVPGGSLGAVIGSVGNKGDLLNPNDPIVHAGADTDIHSDGSSPQPATNADLDIEGYTGPSKGRGRK